MHDVVLYFAAIVHDKFTKRIMLQLKSCLMVVPSAQDNIRTDEAHRLVSSA